MIFSKLFNYKLRHDHFFNGNWHRSTLLNAHTTLLEDKEMKMAWQTLLRKISMTHENEGDLTSPTMKLYQIVCEKFSKRRCVTFLAIDHLNPKNDEQQSAIRQLLRTFERGYQKVPVACDSQKATDKCFKCGEEGHWANQCKKDIPHDPEWVKTQQCYKCGRTGHLKIDCKEASKGSNFKNPGKIPRVKLNKTPSITTMTYYQYNSFAYLKLT